MSREKKITMLPILLLLLSTALAENCSYRYNDQPFSRTSVLTIKGLPTNLVYNPNNKQLYFTLIDLDSLQNDDIQTKMDQYILRKGEPIKIEGINGQAAAVDVKNDKVYIGTDEGLTLLNATDKTTFVGLKDEDIVQLFKPTTGDDLYVVVFPNNEVYKVNLKKNEKSRVQFVPCAFIIAVDEDENIFYECDSKYVKVLLKGFHEPIEFVGIPKNAARAIAVDNESKVILAANDGLYHLRSNNLIPKKLMELDFVPAGIAYDSEDIYISTNGIVYKYSKLNCSKD